MVINVNCSHYMILCVCLFGWLIQIRNRKVYTPFVYVNPYTRFDWNIQARVEQNFFINEHYASKKVKLLLIDSQVIVKLYPLVD